MFAVFSAKSGTGEGARPHTFGSESIPYPC